MITKRARLYAAVQFALLVPAFLLCLFPFFTVSHAETAAAEYEVKAVFIFNFTQFIDWPAGSFTAPESPISICVIGPDPFGEVLDEVVRGERVQNRRISIRRYNTAEETSGCHIAYISKETNDPARVVAQLRGRNLVTVSDAPNFAEDGGTIAFRTVQNRIRIRINLSAVRASGVNVSSKLLRLAETIEGAR